MVAWLGTLRRYAARIKKEIHILYLACRDPRTPWYAKVWVALVVAFALSPIDLIPDFIPVLGYLDDLILVPLGIWLALRMIPTEVLEDCRARASQPLDEAAPRSRLGLAMVAIFWLVALACVLVLLLRLVWPPN